MKCFADCFLNSECDKKYKKIMQGNSGMSEAPTHVANTTNDVGLSRCRVLLHGNLISGTEELKGLNCCTPEEHVVALLHLLSHTSHTLACCITSTVLNSFETTGVSFGNIQKLSFIPAPVFPFVYVCKIHFVLLWTLC